MNYETILLDLAAAISRNDGSTNATGEATNINKFREPYLRVPFELLEKKQGSAIGLWLIDEADSNHIHQATLWQIVPYTSGADAITEATTNPSQKPAVVEIDSSVLRQTFRLQDQEAIRRAFPLSLMEFKDTSARALFSNALGGKIDFSSYHNILLPLRATDGANFIGVLHLVTPNDDPTQKLTNNSPQMTAITKIIAELIEGSRRHRKINVIDKCQNILLKKLSSTDLAVGLAEELLVPCSALTCAIYRPGRSGTLELIAQAYDGQFSSPKTIEHDSFTYWIYQRAIRDPECFEEAHFSNLSVALCTTGAPGLKRDIDLPHGLTADRTSWLSYTVMRKAAENFDGKVPILFIRLLTAPHKGFLGGSFSTTARGIVKSLGVHMSDMFSSLFQLEATKEVRRGARKIRETPTEFITKTDFLKLECEFAKLTRDTLRCVERAYIAHRSTATPNITILRDFDAKPVKDMGEFTWSSKAVDPTRDSQILDLKPYNDKEGADVTIGAIGNFEYGLRFMFSDCVFAGWEGRVLAQIIDEIRIAEMSAVDLNEKMRQAAEIRHALRAEMNGVLGHLHVAKELYNLSLETHRRGDTAIAQRHLLDSAAFRKSLKRAVLSSEALGSVLENSGIQMSKMRPETLQRSAVNIVQMLRDMRTAYMPELDRRRLKIIETGSDSVVASCDARLVRMALFNLFDNAVKYAFNKNPITIRATDHGRHIAIAMTNIGPHIEPAHIDNIFEPFKRVTFKGAQPMPGTGLGLPVARKIAEVHGGQVTVLSEPFRVGDVIQAETTFTFMIPKGFK